MNICRCFLNGLYFFQCKEAKLEEIILYDVLCSFSRIPWISLLHVNFVLKEPMLDDFFYGIAYYCLL